MLAVFFGPRFHLLGIARFGRLAVSFPLVVSVNLATVSHPDDGRCDCRQSSHKSEGYVLPIVLFWRHLARFAARSFAILIARTFFIILRSVALSAALSVVLAMPET